MVSRCARTARLRNDAREAKGHAVSEQAIGGGAETAGRPGPRDFADVDTSEGYVDLGSLLVPVIEGMQLQAKVAPDGRTVQQVIIVAGASGLQVTVAAAPKSGGVWDEVRSDIRTDLERHKASVEERATRYGTELQARYPVTMPDGSRAITPMRIIGREGPRWFARIDMLGRATADEDEGHRLEGVIDRLVVRRDGRPRPRLELLPLHVPQTSEEGGTDAGR